MRLRRPIGWVLFAVVLLATAGSPVLADYKEHFKAGIAAKDLKKWAEAITQFENAVAEHPRAGGKVRISGSFYEEYTPYLHLGIAYQKVGDTWKSKQALELSKREGVLGARERKKLDDLWLLVQDAKDPNKKESQLDQRFVARAKDEFGKSADLESELQKKMKDPGFSQLVPELKSGASDWIADRGRVGDRLAQAKTDGDFKSIENDAKDLNKRAPVLLVKISDGFERIQTRKLEAALNRVARSGPEAKQLGGDLTPQRDQAMAKDPPLRSKWKAADDSLADAQRLEASGRKAGSLKDLDRAAELYEGVIRDRKFLIAQADQLIATGKTNTAAALVQQAKQDVDARKKASRQLVAKAEGFNSPSQSLERLKSDVEKTLGQRPPQDASLEQLTRLAGTLESQNRLLEAAIEAEPTSVAVAVVPAVVPDEDPVEPPQVGLLNELDPRLVEAYDAYTRTRYDEVESVLADVTFDEPWLNVQANLFRAAAFHARYVRGGKQDESLRKKAKQSVGECLKVDPDYSPRKEVFPPPFLAFYRDS